MCEGGKRACKQQRSQSAAAAAWKRTRSVAIDALLLELLVDSGVVGLQRLVLLQQLLIRSQQPSVLCPKVFVLLQTTTHMHVCVCVCVRAGIQFLLLLLLVPLHAHTHFSLPPSPLSPLRLGCNSRP